MGFIKLDLRGSDVRMEVHMQGAGRKPEKGVAYLIARGERTEGVELGELDIAVNSQVSWRFTTKKIMGSPYELSQVLGMGVLFPSGKYIASSWVDAPGEIFARGNFPVWSPKKRKEEPQLCAASVAAAETKERDDAAPQGEWKVHQGTAQLVQPEPSDDAGRFRRIDISDIRTLPKSNWHLCNNSFLIHGFFNYHYLILWEKGENGMKKTYLGVPGIYERPERAMALLFGFPEFVAEETVRGEEPGQAETAGGSFGYWICQLNE